MNKLEQRYALELECQQRAGNVRSYRFEALKLRLADNTFYTPDYLVIWANGDVELVEVKGFWEDDARVKIKVAAEMYPEFLFTAITWDKRAGWQHEHFNR